MPPGRDQQRTITLLVFIASAFALSVLFYRLDIGPDALSPRTAPGGGALLVGLLAAAVLTLATRLVLRVPVARRRRQTAAGDSDRTEHHVPRRSYD